jgi:putative acetyltransferase
MLILFDKPFQSYKMNIRIAQSIDVDAMRQLFRETIETVNPKDYNPVQIQLWAAAAQRIESWQKKVQEQYFILAEKDAIIVGFASIETNGYIDFMYIHKNYQNQGIASLLLSELEAKAMSLSLTKVWANVSITARPFFGKRGFILTNIDTKIIDTIEFENAVMEKGLKC